MTSVSRASSLGLLGLLLLGGCCHPAADRADRALQALGARPLDPEPPPPRPPGPAHAEPSKIDGKKGLLERLHIPPRLPGADAPPVQMPPSTASPRETEAALQRLYQDLPPLRDDPTPALGAEGRPLALADLQRLALEHSPALRQAAAHVEAARGARIQAGLYPNPTIGYEGDTINQANTAGMQGAYFEQTIKTGGKLKLAQAAATMDLQNAELALRQAQNDVMTQVRTAYFAVLVAGESIKVGRALAGFAEEFYRIQIEQVKARQAAAYEPYRVRILAIQARTGLVQAQNRYGAAWKQLASAVGLPDLPPTELAGRVDLPLPLFRQDESLAHVVSQHTEVSTAVNSLQKARYNLRLAQVTPIPDVDLRVMVQKDFTTPPFLAVTSVQLGVPVPVWDRGQGRILEAQGNLMRAAEEAQRVRASLSARVAEAFERYENSRVVLDYYRTFILPDQVRAYRGVYERYIKEAGAVNFEDVINAQQSLTATTLAYVNALGAAWTAVVDVANLLQTTDLFQLEARQEVLPVPDLRQLLPGPCARLSGQPEGSLGGTPATSPSPPPAAQALAAARPELLAAPEAASPANGPVPRETSAGSAGP